MELISRSLAGRPGRLLRRSLGLAAPFMRTEIPVLTYHSIDNTGSLLSVTAGVLRSQLAALRAADWRSLTIGQYAAQLQGAPRDGRSLLITFDDGYRNFADQAAPILAEFGFTATVFVAVDYVGQRPLWLLRDAEMTERLLDEVGMTRPDRHAIRLSAKALLQDPLMDWDALRGLVAAGFDVQSHSAGHHFLTSLPPAALAEDLLRSRLTLEDRLGCAVPAIAYPYGASSPEVACAARAAGFDLGFIADHRPRDADGMMVWRGGVSGQLTPPELLSVMRCWPLYPRLRAWLRQGA